MYEVDIDAEAFRDLVFTIMPTCVTDIDKLARLLLLEAFVMSGSLNVAEGITFIRNATDNQVFKSFLNNNPNIYMIGNPIKLTDIKKHLIAILDSYFARHLTNIYYDAVYARL